MSHLATILAVDRLCAGLSILPRDAHRNGRNPPPDQFEGQSRIRRTAALLLAVGLATSGCLSTHLIRDKARPHEEFSVEDQQVRDVEGQPGYYALLPLTIVGDVATSPFQVVYFLVTDDSHWGSANIHGVPVPLP